MIKNIEIRNFKGIRFGEIPCKGMTLLSGANGSGKSTFIHSLLLLLQTEIEHPISKIYLNGRYVQLGIAEEIQHNWSENSTISFNFTTENEYLNFDFDVELSDDRDVLEASTKKSSGGSNFAKKLKYLSANRIAPGFTFPHSTHEISTSRNIGIFGEYTFAYLSKHGNEEVPVTALIHSDAELHGLASSLLANVTAWMQKISPGLQIKAEILQDIGASKVSYGYPGLSATPNLTSHNVGFGITNVLPVVTRVLMSSPGDILILENPEAHVHPRGQVELGKLLALAADNGIQIFLETHSDHVFNGIRLALKDSINGFNNCALYYVTRESSSEAHDTKFETKFREIKLTESGRIQSAPLGFFDEWETAIMELI